MKGAWLRRARDEAAAAEARLMRWADINSGSNHAAGLARMLAVLEADFGELEGKLEILDCSGGPLPAGVSDFPRHALRLRYDSGDGRDPVLLNGHYDTVYGECHPFQQTERSGDGARLIGPGVADMKGGLVVLLHALHLWQAGLRRDAFSWELLITPDEEIGSTASIPLLKAAARRCRLGLIYESAYEDGGFVRRRKGSGTYTVSALGRAAHVGRNFEEGRNAITALCSFSLDLVEAAEKVGVIANLGEMTGGGPLNVVPDRAVAHWNVRAADAAAFDAFEAALKDLVECYKAERHPEVEFVLQGGVTRPPKTVDAATERLFAVATDAAESLGLPVSWRDTGGGSDGSNLAAYGLPNIDNLGLRGGAIHSDQEYAVLASIPERIALTLALFDAIADGALDDLK